MESRSLSDLLSVYSDEGYSIVVETSVNIYCDHGWNRRSAHCHYVHILIVLPCSRVTFCGGILETCCYMCANVWLHTFISYELLAFDDEHHFFLSKLRKVYCCLPSVYWSNSNILLSQFYAILLMKVMNDTHSNHLFMGILVWDYETWGLSQVRS